MASGTIDLGVSGKITGHISWTSTSDGTAANTSTVTATIYVKRTNSYTTTGYWYGALNVGGSTQSFRVHKAVTNSDVALLTYTATVTHNANGTGTCYISGQINGPTETSQEDSVLYSNATVTLDTIPRYASIEKAPNFNDESNPMITVKNPAGSSVDKVEVCISLDGSKDDVPYREVPRGYLAGTFNYRFDLTDVERTILRKATLNGSTVRTVRFYVKTTIGSNTNLHYVERNLTIINCAPSVSLSVVDTNSATIALTGSSSVLVRHMSTAKASGTATVRKNASAKSQQLISGSNKSTTGSLIIANVSTPTFSYNVVDTRNQTASVEQNLSTLNRWVPYIKPTCVLSNKQVTIDGTAASLSVTVSGNCYNGCFDIANSTPANANTITVYYRYKTLTGSFNSWQTATATMAAAASTDKYSAAITISDLDYNTAYSLEVYAEDLLNETAHISQSFKASPVFDWSDEDFNLNVPLLLNGDIVLRRNGDNGNIVLASPSGQDGVFIRPNGTGSSSGQTIFYKDGTVTHTGTVLCNRNLRVDGNLQVKNALIPVGISEELWSSTGYQMSADHEIPLAYPISATVHGIVLIFSQYNSSTGAGVDSNFHSFFIPKAIVQASNGASHTFQMAPVNFSSVCGKVLYIYDTRIQGHKMNDQTGTSSSGIKYTNTAFVLRKVLAV